MNGSNRHCRRARGALEIGLSAALVVGGVLALPGCAELATVAGEVEARSAGAVGQSVRAACANAREAGRRWLDQVNTSAAPAVVAVTCAPERAPL